MRKILNGGVPVFQGNRELEFRADTFFYRYIYISFEMQDQFQKDLSLHLCGGLSFLLCVFLHKAQKAHTSTYAGMRMLI